MSGEQAAVAEVLAAHHRSGVSSVDEGCGDDERTVGYHAWCYCDAAPDEGSAQWRGTFKVPAETAAAELRAHVAAAIVAALATATTARLSDEERDDLCDALQKYRHRSEPAPERFDRYIVPTVEAILAARAVQPTPPAQAEAVAALDEVEHRIIHAIETLDPRGSLFHLRAVRAALAPTAADQVAAMRAVADADHAARVVADVEGRRE